MYLGLHMALRGLSWRVLCLRLFFSTLNWRMEIEFKVNLFFITVKVSRILTSAAKQQGSWVVFLWRSPLTFVWPGISKDCWMGLIRAPSDGDWNAIWWYFALIQLLSSCWITTQGGPIIWNNLKTSNFTYKLGLKFATWYCVGVSNPFPVNL